MEVEKPKTSRIKRPDTKVEIIDDVDPPIGPKTGNLLPEWRKDRDYVNFNPTPDK